MKSRLLLLTAAVIWGLAFVAQRKGMEYVQPFTFNGIRFLVGAVSLMPLAWISQRRNAVTDIQPSAKMIWLGGGLVGLTLFLGSSLQQIGMVETTAGKAGFITGLYVILVPLMGLVLGLRPGWLTWVGATVAVIGLYLLTVNDALAIERGDLLVLSSTLFLSVHVHLIGRWASQIGAIRLSLIQSIVVVVVSLIVALMFESIRLEGLLDALVPILYTGILSVGVAYTLQVVGQKETPPAQAVLILSLETVFAGLGGWLILGETLPLRGLIGCGLMFAGMVVSQLEPSRQS